MPAKAATAMPRRSAAILPALALIPWLICSLLGGAAPPAHAAYISEVFFDDGRGEAGMPNSVELANLNALPTDAVDLIIIDARLDNLGIVWQIISIPTNDAVLLVSERDWPSDLWGPDTRLGDNRLTLDQLGAGESFNFTFARTLMLYDRTTRVAEDPVQNLFSDEQQQRLDGAELLDAVTFVPQGGLADPDAPGATFEIQAGDALVRPLLDGATLGPSIIAGHATETGVLAGTEPPLPLTPGMENPVWHSVPEPTTAAMMLAALAAMLTRRAARAKGGGTGQQAHAPGHGGM